MASIWNFTTKVDNFDDVIGNDVNDLQTAADKLGLAALLAEFANTQTISGTKTLTDDDAAVQYINGGAANRDVVLPAESAATHVFYIYNNGSTNSLVVKNDGGTTIVTLTPGKGALLVCDDTTWTAASGGASALDDLSDVTITTPAAGQTMRYDGSGWVNISIEDGWLPAGETWTYASADSPTFTFTISGDKTGKYSVGMRLKLTQTTVKYFIVTAVAYGAPNTTVTVYGGTDYTLANATITSPYYSTAKAPQGFPLSPEKWTVTFTDSTDVSQASPTNNTWYNLGSLSFSVPIGVWQLRSSLYLEGLAGSATTINIFATLSTANNSESNTGLTSGGLVASNTSFRVAVERVKTLTAASKTTYYILAVSRASSISSIAIKGTLSASIVELVCAYL